MYTTKWEALDANISRLGFGCMRLPTNAQGNINEEEAQKLIDYAYKNGVNYFDTAHYYHGGESQLFIGKALLKYPRESFYLATKLPLWDCSSLQKAEEIFAQQLANCQVNYFDFYLLHAMDEEKWQQTLNLKILDKLLEYKKAGKIKQLGFSFHGQHETFYKMLDYCDWDFVQIQINYIDDKLQDSRALYARLEEKGIPCIVMEPVRGGFLANLPPAATQNIASEAFGKYSPAGWALRWCQSLGNAAIILSGMSLLSQVEENVKLFSSAPPLSVAEAKMLEEIRDYILSMKTVPCTHCGYCMDCPFGVNIPEVFTLYNKFELFKNPFESSWQYAALPEEQKVGSCTACGKCKKMCPQNIDIPAQLQLAGNALKMEQPAE